MEKGGLQDYNYTLCWKLNPSQVETISHVKKKTVSSIGLIPILRENSHATAILNRVVNLVKEAVKYLNPN